MKIVVTYETDGGYECGSYLNVYCFNYDSAEAWFLDFEEALKNQIEKWEKNRKEIDNYWRNMPRVKDKSIPIEVSDEFYFCGREFSIHTFKNKEGFCLPLVLELDEWFEQQCVNK